jgi:predicted dehydrogenase
VLCEKPLALNVVECRRMIAAAKRNRRLLMEAFMYRLHPQTLKLQEIIQNGTIGEVRVIRAGFGFSLNERAMNVRLAKRMGGGCLMDVGCYCVNAMRTFSATNRAGFGTGQTGKISGVDMTFGGVLMFSQGRFGVFTSSFQTILDWGVEIVGTLGRISVPSPWKPDGRLASFVMEAHGKRTVVQIKNGGGIYHCEVDHFSRCILKGKPLAMPPEEGLKNMRVIEALYNSARRGRAVRVKV